MQCPLPLLTPRGSAVTHRAGGTVAASPAATALRAGFVTDNSNVILDVADLRILNPAELEARINNIVGVVTNGLFAIRGADVILVGAPTGVMTLDAHRF